MTMFEIYSTTTGHVVERRLTLGGANAALAVRTPGHYAMRPAPHPADHMRKLEPGARFYLTQDEREYLATSLVRGGGEGFDFLDAYEDELQYAIEYNLEEDTIDPELVTESDYTHIRRMVAEATVTVHLPDIPEPLLEEEMESLAARIYTMGYQVGGDGWPELLVRLAGRRVHVSDGDRIGNKVIAMRQELGE
jgi:hypothetical protein